jgi:hypothetical protein
MVGYAFANPPYKANVFFLRRPHLGEEAVDGAAQHA